MGSDVNLRIYTHVREDAIQLYGFNTRRERDLYLKLISVQGVGAKSGISMLSGMSADEIVAAIRSNDLARLKSIPGVGLKTAERLVVELRDKVSELADAGSGLDSASRAVLPKDAVFEDALSALINLGYQKNAAEKALAPFRALAKPFADFVQPAPYSSMYLPEDFRIKSIDDLLEFLPIFVFVGFVEPFGHDRAA